MTTREIHTIHCYDCGHRQVGTGPLADRCPGCGHPLRFPKDGYSEIRRREQEDDER